MCNSLFSATVVLGGALLAATTTGCGERPELTDPTENPSARTPFSSASFQAISRRAAVVIRNNECRLFNGDGQLVLADRSIVIATQSTRLNTTFICKVKNVANSSGRAVRYDSDNNPFGPGVGCGILRPDQFVITTDWTESVSSSGNATIRCHFKL
jgi:hypothetical protein